MPIILNHQLREKTAYDPAVFPISFYCDELATLPNWAGPLHWHPDFEIATAETGLLDYQVGQQHILLNAGDSVFVNGNMLHGIRQLSGDVPDPMPNIVFSGTVIAPQTSAVYQKYILPIAGRDCLPFIVFRQEEPQHDEINRLIRGIYHAFREQTTCYEMTIQRNISCIFEYIYQHIDSLPETQAARVRLNAQIRLQKMLSYIYEHYTESITLENIASAANISRSEAGRCFNAYMNCSPVEALIRHRLQVGRRLLNETTLTLHEISDECGFHSVGYFSRQFRKIYGHAPGQNRESGK